MKVKTILTVLCLLAVMILTQSCSEENVNEEENTPVDTKKESVSLMGISVIENGAKADGITDDSEAFAIVDGMGIVVPCGKYKIAQNMTVSLPITFAPGAVLDIDSGVTVTFNGYVDAGLYCIFENGSVIMKNNSTVYPEWFGAAKDGTGDSTSAIQRAVDCFPYGYGRVEFSAGKYNISDTINVKSGQCHLTLEGTARQTREVAPEIVMYDTNKVVLRILGNTSGRDYDGSLEDVTVRNLEFSRAKMGKAQSDTILVENTLYTTFENVGFSLSQNGLRAVNCNGLRINACHGTSGGDIEGDEVRGIYIDGSERGSAGILITDYIYYGYASPNSITYAYKDYNGENAVGTNVGDRRITNFECAGNVNYGIAIISDSSGWAGDIAISAVSMDSVRTAGIYLYAKNPQSYQQANISNSFFRLSKIRAEAVMVDTFCNVNISNLTVENAASGGKNTALSLVNTSGGTITSTAFTGGNYDCIVSYDKCIGNVFTGNTSVSAGKISVNGSKNCIVSSNSMVNAQYIETDSTNCVTGLNIFS